MAYIKNASMYEVEREQIIYVIVSPIDRRFFVGKVTKNNARNRYKNHYTLRHTQTKSLFQESLAAGERPRMYLLEEVNQTEKDAYRHVIAWIRFFKGHGYTSCAYPETNRYADNIRDESKEFFRTISTLNITELLSPEKELFPNYGGKYEARKEKNGDEDTVITMKLTVREAEDIRKKADERGQSINKYCRACVLDGAIYNYSFEYFTEYINELRYARNNLKQVILAIYQNRNYYPEELKQVQELADTVAEHEAKITDKINRTMRSFHRKVNATAVKIKAKEN